MAKVPRSDESPARSPEPVPGEEGRPEAPDPEGHAGQLGDTEGELYIVDKAWPTAKPLATSKRERDGKDNAVAWTNQYGKAKVFGTTYGHSDATFDDPVFHKLVARGLLWVTGRLKD